MKPTSTQQFKFTGHETFPLRIAWIPKVVRAIESGIQPFCDMAHSVTLLGLGRNMVSALKFWIEIYGVAEQAQQGDWALTEFGNTVFGRAGYDPYLEDTSSLWLLHWKISSRHNEPLFAWNFLLNNWPEPDFTSTEAVKSFHHQAEEMNRKLSPVTLRQHFDIFLHTYLPSKHNPRKGSAEDSIDCPLVELRLIVKVGERENEKGRQEAIYAFNREIKTALSDDVFLYAVHDFWNKNHPLEKTLPLRELVYGENSPGKIFCLSEKEVRDRLIKICTSDSDVKIFDSANQRQVQRLKKIHPDSLLRDIYPSPSMCTNAE